MKTADLIPFILLELNNGDKYGFELTKEIENKSNGSIVIKQPTLYTLLKKLEKSKFISSYWQDSEIGGKRHYYKLTQNGRLQVSTLPSYDFLLKNAISNEENEGAEDVSATESPFEMEEKPVSFMEDILNKAPISPIESIIPSDEIFDNNNIDSATEIDINSSNSQILKDEIHNINEEFASNDNVKKFTEKLPLSSPTIIETPQNQNSILDIEFSVSNNGLEVDYVDYVDFKNTEKYKKAKSTTKKLLLQSLVTSSALFVVTLICALITSFTGRSPLYYIFFIASLSISLFYPILFAIKIDKLKIKYQEHEYSCKTKLKLFAGITLLLTVMIVCIVVNISIKNSSFRKILSFNNFENFYAPLLITSVYFLDVLFNHMFLERKNKQEK